MSIVRTAAISIFVFGVAATQPAQAQSTTPVANTILQIATGWNSDGFSLTTDQPRVNPLNCPNTDLYSSDAANPGHKTHYAAALLAFATGRRISLAISQSRCADNGRPLIIGLAVLSN